MGNSHLIDYFVITAADVTAILLAWLAGKGWIVRKAREISKVNWQRSGNLFWLSSDLMWTWMYANSGNIPRMNHGLNKVVHHASSLGISDPILLRLKTLQGNNAGKQSLTGAEKTAIIHELDDIISQIGKQAELQQADFKADPDSAD